MIKATDLRIGNYILDSEVKPFYFQVEEIRKHVGYELWAIYRQGSIKAKEVEGIPLTEEWLMKLPSNLTYPKWIKYLHELQNWYYWNNEKKELRINL
jgi:hypothetical protein